jgi:hypothetical protein
MDDCGQSHISCSRTTFGMRAAMAPRHPKVDPFTQRFPRLSLDRIAHAGIMANTIG